MYQNSIRYGKRTTRLLLQTDIISESLPGWLLVQLGYSTCSSSSRIELVHIQNNKISTSDRILKIGQHLMKVWQKLSRLLLDHAIDQYKGTNQFIQCKCSNSPNYCEKIKYWQGNDLSFTEVGRIMIRWTNETTWAKVRNKPGDDSRVNALTFCKHIQLQTQTHNQMIRRDHINAVINFDLTAMNSYRQYVTVRLLDRAL